MSDAEKAGVAEVVVSSGRKVAMGSEWWDIRDDGTPVQFVDVLTECRQHNGVISLAFGSAIIDVNNNGMVSIAARLRLDIVFAQNLRDLLNNTIADALKPTDKSSAN